MFLKIRAARLFYGGDLERRAEAISTERDSDAAKLPMFVDGPDYSQDQKAFGPHTFVRKKVLHHQSRAFAVAGQGDG